MTDTSEIKVTLTERRAMLAARVSELEAKRRAPHNPDSEEQATEREDDDVVDELETSALHEIDQIDATLKRLETGAYGACEKCGGKIGRKRLEALLHAVHCIECAA